MTATADTLVAPIVQEPAICIDTATWGAMLTKWKMTDWRARAEWEAYVTLPDNSPDRHWMADLTSESADAVEDATDALMSMPSPHLAALRWKLDRVFVDDSCGEEGCMNSWSMDYLAQTIADYKSLLPEGA